MGIVGELFSEEVSTQIKQREQYLADKGTSDPLGPVDPKKVKIQNAGSWLRLISSVDLAVPSDQNIPGNRKKEIEDRVLELSNHLQVEPGNDLAKKVILYGGTQRFIEATDGGTGTFEKKSGFSDKKGEFFGKAAYGFGGNAFGYKPMPGIQSAKIGFYNNGALAKADISIVCFNPQQLEFLELLYLRPGYSILLEYGHTQYVNNQGESKDFNLVTSQTYPMDLFLKNTTGQEELLDAIQTERLNRSQNYDAFYGIVTNFSWSFNQDGSFTVSIKAISKGSVIESLKINTGGVKPEDTTDATVAGGEETDEPKPKVPLDIIISRAADSMLFSKLYELTRLFSSSINTSGAHPNAKSLIVPLGYQVVRDTIGQIKPTGPSSFFEGYYMWKMRYYKHADDDDRQELGDAQYLMSFASFLQIIQEYCLLYNEKGEPTITFEFSDVPMLTFPGMFSANPTVCIVPPFYTVTDILLKEEEGQLIPELFFQEGPKQYLESIQTAPKFLLDENPFVGNLMSVLLNFTEVLRVVDSKEDKDGNVNLIEFITAILNDVSKALGGVNDFEVKFDQIKQRISIFDKASHIKSNSDDDKDKITVFKPYGRTANKSTILTDISFNSELTPEFASMIAIGAQANGNQVGSNATAFSEFNLGLVDRINKEKVVTKNLDGKNTKQTEEERFKSILENIKPLFAEIYWINWEDPNSLNFQNLYNLTLSKKSIQTLTSLNLIYAKYIIGYFTTVAKTIASPFFIPFNLQLTLGGIAGIKLFQKYGLEEGILPYSYKGKINFLIKNLTHTIDKNRWTTTLESLTVPIASKLNSLKLNLLKPLITGSTNINESFGNENIVAKYGLPGESNLVVIEPPYPMFFGSAPVRTFQVHKDVQVSLVNALKQIKDKYGLSRIKQLSLDQFSGLYNYRKIRGGDILSLHSWGIAIDINGIENGLNQKNKPYVNEKGNKIAAASFSRAEYKDFIDIMEKNGWYSLGRSKNFDYMHFQAWDPKKPTGTYTAISGS